VLVAAVLRPQEREDGQLEVVGLALQQADDAIELPVRQTELAMERLFRDGAQEASLASGPAATGAVEPGGTGKWHMRGKAGSD
jgi:hypothetical protein